MSKEKLYDVLFFTPFYLILLFFIRFTAGFEWSIYGGIILILLNIQWLGESNDK